MVCSLSRNLQSIVSVGIPHASNFVLVYLHEVRVIRQAFAESAEAHAPRARSLQRVFEVGADSDHRRAAVPTFAAPAALITVAAHEILLFHLHVAEARQVNSVRAIAERHFVFVARHDCARAGAHVVIHQIVAEFAAAVAEAVRKFAGRRIQQNARRFQRRRVEEINARVKLRSSLSSSRRSRERR